RRGRGLLRCLFALGSPGHSRGELSGSNRAANGSGRPFARCEDQDIAAAPGRMKCGIARLPPDGAFSSWRPVTPEVAGSSPVAPVTKLPAPRHVRLVVVGCEGQASPTRDAERGLSVYAFVWWERSCGERGQAPPAACALSDRRGLDTTRRRARGRRQRSSPLRPPRGLLVASGGPRRRGRERCGE